MSSRGSALRLRGELVHVGVELEERRPLVVAGVLGIVRADHLVRPLEEQMPVLLRHAHDVGDRLQGQFGGELLDEVAAARLDDAVDDHARAVAQVLLDQADHARGEALVDQLAVAGVLGRIGVEHQDARGCRTAPSFTGRSPMSNMFVPPSLGRVRLRVAVDLDQIGMLDDVPEAAPGREVVPGHRILGAQPAKPLVMLTALESIHVQQVDTRPLSSSATPFVAGLATPLRPRDGLTRLPRAVVPATSWTRRPSTAGLLRGRR